MGITVSTDEIVSAPVAAATLVRDAGHEVVAPFLADAVLEDLGGLILQGGTAAPGSRRPTAILLGDLGERWDSRAAAGGIRVPARRRRTRHLLPRPGVPAAATGWCSTSGRSWPRSSMPAAATALLAGKPSPVIYDTAVGQLGAPRCRAVAVW